MFNGTIVISHKGTFLTIVTSHNGTLTTSWSLLQAKSEKLWTAVARREVVEAVLADWLELCQENQVEWSTLIGPDPSKSRALIG